MQRGGWCRLCSFVGENPIKWLELLKKDWVESSTRPLRRAEAKDAGNCENADLWHKGTTGVYFTFATEKGLNLKPSINLAQGGSGAGESVTAPRSRDKSESVKPAAYRKGSSNQQAQQAAELF